MKTIKLLTWLFFSSIITKSQNYLPIGYLDYVDQSGGYGWTYDEDAGAQAIDVHIYIDGRLYTVVTANLNRPDLVNAGVTPDPYHGYSFTITGFDTTRAHEVIVYAINYGGGVNPSLTNCPAIIGTPPSGDASISNIAGPSNIVISTTQRLAGAIGSLTWNGKEFIDSYDHGRELQSATSFDGYGECFNPTEAGSSQDGTGNISTSFLQYLNASSNYLETQTLPAFWTQPGYTAPGCGSAVNTTQRSSHYFHKKVTIGMPGMAHVIEYKTEFDIPSNESYTSGTFEVVTGYMPTEFSVFWNYNPATQQLTSLSDGPGEQQIPIIFSTTDNNYAMGIYSPDLPQSTFPSAGYGRFRFSDCTKWNCVFRESPVPSGTYKYRSYVMVGSLNNVETSMIQLYNYFRITADFSADTVCVGTPTYFTDMTIGQNSETLYQWDIYNDGTIDDTTSGNFPYNFSSAGVFQVKLTVINGVSLDHQSSIIKDVVVLAPSDTNLIVNACESYISPSGNYTWTNSGTYTDIIPNTEGCDSVISINLTVNSVDTSVTVNPPTLTANAINATYQWITCNGIAITGETNQSYTATANGYYAVVVTQNGCTDTSVCYAINSVSTTNKSAFSDEIIIYPNPTQNNLKVTLPQNVPDVQIMLYNPLGQVVFTEQNVNTTVVEIPIKGLSGIYFMEIKANDQQVWYKVVKE